MKILSLFSGIGAFEKALTNMGVDYELVNYCEIDKYASKSYAAIHGVSEDMNLGDITKVDTSKLPKDIDLITYGFPCQDISLAGKQRGFEHDGNRTRSGLFFEALRLIEDIKPRFAICENVKNLTSKKFEKEFEIVLSSLEDAGYKNYWKVLNAKDYGIPQNRERVFVVSIREDIDKGYTFPEAFPLELRLKDMLDAEVDEKYYIDSERASVIHDDCQNKDALLLDICQYRREGHPREYNEIAPTLAARDWKDPRLVQVAQLYGTETEPNPQAGRVYDSDGLSPTMDTCSGGNRMPKVVVREATKTGYAEAIEGDSINLEQPNSETRRGRVGHGVAQTLTTSPQQPAVVNSFVNGDVCKSVRVGGHGSVDRHSWDMVEQSLRIRKLTPKECYRLMGFSDEDYFKAEAVNSNTQLYKQAGNSIVVNVLMAIFEELFKVYGNEKKVSSWVMELLNS